MQHTKGTLVLRPKDYVIIYSRLRLLSMSWYLQFLYKTLQTLTNFRQSVKFEFFGFFSVWIVPFFDFRWLLATFLVINWIRDYCSDAENLSWIFSLNLEKVVDWFHCW